MIEARLIIIRDSSVPAKPKAKAKIENVRKLNFRNSDCKKVFVRLQLVLLNVVGQFHLNNLNNKANTREPEQIFRFAIL